MPNHGIVAARAGVDAAIVKIQRQLDAGMFCDERVNSRPQMQRPKVTGAEMRNGPIKDPRRSDMSAAASFTS